MGMDCGGFQVLLVEDDPVSMEMVKRLLETGGAHRFVTHSVESLETAIQILSARDFDAVVLDLNLPDSLGLDTFLRIQEFAPGLPIVVVTGHDNEEMAIQAMHAGAQDYLVKGSLRAGLLVRSIRYAIERNRLLDKVRALSLEDDLTGLCSRRGFTVLAAQLLRVVQRTDDRMALLFLDLDDLKDVNDSLGHATGDQVLREAGELLRESFRNADLMARIGGDEFVVLLMASQECSPARITRRLQENLDRFNQTAGRPYKIEFSVGVAWYDPESPISLEELLAKADALMYEQKRGKQEMVERRARGETEPPVTPV